MNICHIITNFSNGGAEKIVVELANIQQKKGHNVSIVVFDKITENMIHYKNLDSKVNTILIKRFFKFDIIVVIRLLVFFLRNSIDVIHSHKPSSIIYLIPTLCFLNKKVSVVHTVHSELKYYRNLYSILDKIYIVRNKVKNVCLTKEIMNDFTVEYPKMSFYYGYNGILQPKTTVNNSKVRNFVHNLKQNPKDKVLLFVGRNAEQKNLDLLFGTMEKLVKENFKLICIGLNKNEILKQYSVKDIIDINVFVIGTKSNIGDYLQYVDALILSSKNEGMPLVVIEALSYGKPIISTTVGGIPNMISEDVNGFLSDEISVNGLLTAINKFQNAPEIKIMEIYSNNTKKFIDKYSIEICYQSYLKIYQNKDNRFK